MSKGKYKTVGQMIAGQDVITSYPGFNPLYTIEDMTENLEKEEKQKKIMLSILEDALGDKEIWLISKGLDKRIENQLRIHWYWLKDKGYKEVAKFINAIIKGSG